MAVDVAHDIGHEWGSTGGQPDLSEAPPELLEAFRFDLSKPPTLAEYAAMPDVGWYLGLKAVMDAFQSGQRAGAESAKTRRQETAQGERHGRGG